MAKTNFLPLLVTGYWLRLVVRGFITPFERAYTSRVYLAKLHRMLQDPWRVMDGDTALDNACL